MGFVLARSVILLLCNPKGSGKLHLFLIWFTEQVHDLVCIGTRQFLVEQLVVS